jgi:hypothetical protein
MRHLKKFESSNSEKTGKYYTDEEILDFFQEFMDNNDFEVEIRRGFDGEELNRYLSSFSGEYYIDIVKTIQGSKFNFKYDEDSSFCGYQNPSQLLKSMDFMKDLNSPIERLKSVNYEFGCEFEIHFEEDIRFFSKIKRFLFIKIIFLIGSY